jgi:hypothetical protein
MKPAVVRMVVGAVLLGAWLYLIASGLAARPESAPLIDFIKCSLAGLAAHSVLKGDPAP